MPRITPPDVQAIINRTASDDALTFWIGWANTVIDDADITASESTLTDLERLVAAHGVSAQEPTEAATTIADLRVEYEGEAGPGLRETRYGRRAITLDPSGELAAYGLQAPTFETFGSSTDYTDDYSREEDGGL